MADVKLVVGLGNPGAKYARTRHNLGFNVIDSMAESLGLAVKKSKFGARVGEGHYRGRKLVLLKPWQFMNRSGGSVAMAAEFYKIEPDDLMVVYDDMALEPGKIRLRAKGSAGGHNGMADIIAKLGISEFARCRVGVGACPGAEAIGWVLGRPSEQEKPLLNEAILQARDAVLCWLDYGIEKTMNDFNSGQA